MWAWVSAEWLSVSFVQRVIDWATWENEFGNVREIDQQREVCKNDPFWERETWKSKMRSSDKMTRDQSSRESSNRSHRYSLKLQLPIWLKTYLEHKYPGQITKTLFAIILSKVTFNLVIVLKRPTSWNYRFRLVGTFSGVITREPKGEPQTSSRETDKGKVPRNCTTISQLKKPSQGLCSPAQAPKTPGEERVRLFLVIPHIQRQSITKPHRQTSPRISTFFCDPT